MGTQYIDFSRNSTTDFHARIVGDEGGLHFEFANSSTIASSILPDGTYQSSDRRLKKDIEPLYPALQKLASLPAMRYRYIADDKKESIGFMAQDVKAAFPELVSPFQQDGEEYLAVNYAGMSVVAVKAIQEQQAQIEVLKKQVADLQEAVRALSNK